MSKGSEVPSFFNLMYPDKDSVAESMLPLPISPINYKDATSKRDERMLPTISLRAYNDSYLLGQQPIHQPNKNNGVLLNSSEGGTINDVAASHPGPS
jgi:hypothetical protein